jgi:DNA polymerase
VAAKSLIRDAKSLGQIRGKLYDLELSSVQLAKPVKILATFHPAALLRNPGWKKDAWADLKILLAAMGR